jgi:hypothetical protein
VAELRKTVQSEKPMRQVSIQRDETGRMIGAIIKENADGK